MANSTDTFQYTPLNEDKDCLRLLILQPRGSRIDCKLEHRTFTSKPEYETLSYTWGTAEANRTIYVNDKPFLIRENLYDALTHLQQSTSRAIWVDAICINQANIPERNYQVSLMSFIYMRASRVVVWLNLQLDESVIVKRQGRSTTKSLRETMDETQNLAALANHPYWTRVWVIQELILPKEVQFLVNEFRASEAEFYSISSKITDGRFPEKIKTIQNHRENRHTEEFRLQQLIRTFHDLECTEKRDKIFGFLGLAHDDGIDVDYGLRFGELYANLMEFHQDSEAEASDWRTRDGGDRAAKLMHFSELVQKVFEGVIDQDMRQSPQSSSRIFTVRGATVSKILYLGPTHDEVVSSMSAEKAWRGARRNHYSDYSELPVVLEADRMYTRSLIGWDQQQVDRVRGIGATESHGYRREPCEDALAIRAAQIEITEPSQPRRFLGTRGCFGMAPGQAKVGDAVACFLDCESYVILRPTETDLWTIIGKASATGVRTRGELKFSAVEAVRYGPEYYQKSHSSPWDKGEGYYDGIRNAINLRLDLRTLQQLTC